MREHKYRNDERISNSKRKNKNRKFVCLNIKFYQNAGYCPSICIKHIFYRVSQEDGIAVVDGDSFITANRIMFISYGIHVFLRDARGNLDRGRRQWGRFIFILRGNWLYEKSIWQDSSLEQAAYLPLPPVFSSVRSCSCWSPSGPPAGAGTAV